MDRERQIGLADGPIRPSRLLRGIFSNRDIRECFHPANVDTNVFGLLFEQPAGQRGVIVQRRARVGLLARGYVYPGSLCIYTG